MGYFPFYMDIEGKLCVIAGEERLHTARYVTCFLLVQLSRSFPRMECRVIRSGRGTVLWEPSETVQTAFFCRG